MSKRDRKRHESNGGVAVLDRPTIIHPPAVAAPLRLDLGCGPNPRDGFEGADRLPFGGKVKYVLDLGSDRWPWKDGSVDEVHSSHFLEHLTAVERCHCMNELWRVLKPGRWENGKPVGGIAVFIVPHWGSCRAYGDPTHQWPPIGEFWPLYLNKEWRMLNAPHADATNNPELYSCDFDTLTGQAWNPVLNARNEEYRQFAMSWYREGIHDLHLHLTARK